MLEVVTKMLKEVDFNTATLSDILQKLSDHFDVEDEESEAGSEKEKEEEVKAEAGSDKEKEGEEEKLED
ncbi:hypothetical protein HID58_094083 [Brassica napus]|uniref:DEK C-terminal domain-containing protein n=1 Tax=Brassica napus TaxID=3708 RepID=A0ABQ7XAZ7_BRANA|nr:hypothetical protein HID58_094083 [Brassica napus]